MPIETTLNIWVTYTACTEQKIHLLHIETSKLGQGVGKKIWPQQYWGYCELIETLKCHLKPLRIYQSYTNIYIWHLYDFRFQCSFTRVSLTLSTETAHRQWTCNSCRNNPMMEKVMLGHIMNEHAPVPRETPCFKRFWFFSKALKGVFWKKRKTFSCAKLS